MICPSNLFTEQCRLEKDIDYSGNDDTMTDGKLTCSSKTNSLCTRRTSVHDITSCKLFCQQRPILSEFFSWKDFSNECFCKHSDSGRRHQGGAVSGTTKCLGECPCATAMQQIPLSFILERRTSSLLCISITSYLQPLNTLPARVHVNSKEFAVTANPPATDHRTDTHNLFDNDYLEGAWTFFRSDKSVAPPHS